MKFKHSLFLLRIQTFCPKAKRKAGVDDGDNWRIPLLELRITLLQRCLVETGMEPSVTGGVLELCSTKWSMVTLRLPQKTQWLPTITFVIGRKISSFLQKYQFHSVQNLPSVGKIGNEKLNDKFEWHFDWIGIISLHFVKFGSCSSLLKLSSSVPARLCSNL